jgi:uncharacterized protein (TIGR02453 family)
MAFFTKDFLAFFQELSANNNKEWFDLNRKRYEKEVKDPFKIFVQLLIDKLAVRYPTMETLLAKDCVFRINRDIRFSKEKTPYKTMVSAVIGEGGKKAKHGRGFYFELTPEHVRVYGGVFEIEREDLQLLREDISFSLDKFKAAYTDERFVKVFGHLRGEKNKILPKNIQVAAQKEPLLFNKQFYFFTEMTAKTVLDENLDKLLIAAYEASAPVENYFHGLLNH